MKAAANEPAEGATTMKKKAQEKLAAKANPVVVSEVEASPEVSESVANEAVSEVPAQETTTEVVSEAVETPAEEAAAE
jgi:small subunit ribosomal protein S16